jgi:hypothetical protein
MPAHFPGLGQVHQQKVVDIRSWDLLAGKYFFLD